MSKIKKMEERIMKKSIMRKRYAVIASVMMLALVTGCGKEEKTTEATTEVTTQAEVTTEEAVGGAKTANPWKSITEEEAVAKIPRLFKAPDDAEDIKWSVMESEEIKEPMVQLEFESNDTDFTARAQVGGNEEDISGMYVKWTATEDVTLSNWGDGNMPAKIYSYTGDGEDDNMLITWFDVEIGINYSLSATGDDLNGLDLQAVADQIYADREASAGDSEAASEDGQNPVMNIIGKYGCDRATMTIEAEGDDEARINVTWGSSAFEHAEWNMVGKFDTATNTVNYTDCEKKVITYKDDDTIEKEEVVYTDGTGSIKVNDDYSLEWTDDKEHIADGSKFVFAN